MFVKDPMTGKLVEVFKSAEVAITRDDIWEAIEKEGIESIRSEYGKENMIDDVISYIAESWPTILREAIKK